MNILCGFVVAVQSQLNVVISSGLLNSSGQPSAKQGGHYLEVVNSEHLIQIKGEFNKIRHSVE